MPITPETKSWIWVLEKTCPECGFDAAAVDVTATGQLVRENAAQWQELLGHPQVLKRPSDDCWSALEYACHVRDVLRLFDRRLEWMLTQDGPQFPNWDQDATAVEEAYGSQDVSQVAHELADAAAVVAQRFDTVTGEQWQRSGFRSDGAAFTVESFARYFLHDPMHHVMDARRGFRMLS